MIYEDEIERLNKRVAELEGILEKITVLNNKRDRFSSEIDALIVKTLKNSLCFLEDGDEMCDDCNCWKHTRAMCG